MKKGSSRRDLNPRPADYKSAAMPDAILENKPNSDDLKFSKPPRRLSKSNEHSVGNGKGISPNGNPLKGAPYMSIGAYIVQPVDGKNGETHAERFIRTEKAKDAKDYVNRLKEMTWYYTPSDVKEAEIVTGFNKQRLNAVSRFLAYFKRNLTDNDALQFNGYDIEAYRTAAKEANKDYDENYKEASEDVTYNPTPEEIREVVSYIGGDVVDKAAAARVQVLVYLAAYSGARLEQIWRYLTDNPPKSRRFKFFPESGKKDFFRIDVSNVGEGHKDTMFYYLPFELISAVRSLTLQTSHDYIGKVVANAGRDNVKVIPELDEFDRPTGNETVEKRPISFKTMRKYNMLNLVLAGVDSKVANAIQGRKAIGVDAEHYVKYGDETAVQQYPRFLKLMRQELPVPDWMKDWKDGEPTPDIVKRTTKPKPKAKATSKTATKRLSKFAPITEADKKKIIDLYRQGNSGNAISKMTPYARDTVQKVIKEYKGL